MAQLATLYIGHHVGGLLTHGHQQIVKWVASHVHSFTAFEGIGGWNGEVEPVTVVQVYGMPPPQALQLAHAAECHFGQEKVLAAMSEANLL